MSPERRKIDKAFKLMTVELSKSRANLNELAKELGIRVELIYRWRRELIDKRSGSFPGHGKPKHTGWALSQTLKAKDTTVAALKMAIGNRPITKPSLFHSDRGVQYACDEFRKVLQAYPLIKQSMSRKANCWDNAVAESFFKTLETEGVYGNRFENQNVAAREIFAFIEIWYNRERLHSSLGYRTPAQMEELFFNNPLAA